MLSCISSNFSSASCLFGEIRSSYNSIYVLATIQHRQPNRRPCKPTSSAAQASQLTAIQCTTAQVLNHYSTPFITIEHSLNPDGSSTAVSDLLSSTTLVSDQRAHIKSKLRSYQPFPEEADLRAEMENLHGKIDGWGAGVGRICKSQMGSMGLCTSARWVGTGVSATMKMFSGHWLH